MDRKKRYKLFLYYFDRKKFEIKTVLRHSSLFHLIVAVVLSAQCTDVRVNIVTRSLFKSFPTADMMSKAPVEQIFFYISSVSYPNNKAKYLSLLSKRLVTHFSFHLPKTREELMSLPGVGRKGAHVILSEWYKQNYLAVDTHVARVSKRLGLVKANLKTALAIEKMLTRYLPRLYWRKAHHWLILHGRTICKAISPNCKGCPLRFFCFFYNKGNSVNSN